MEFFLTSSAMARRKRSLPPHRVRRSEGSRRYGGYHLSAGLILLLPFSSIAAVKLVLCSMLLSRLAKNRIEKVLAPGTSSKEKMTPSVHEELDKAVYTWHAIIENCFTHSGFKLGDSEDDSADNPAESSEAMRPPAETIATWAALQDAREVPPSVELEDFVDANTDMVAHEELNDEDIIKSVRDEAHSDDDTAPNLPPPPSTARVLDAYDVLRNFMAAHDDDVTMQLHAEYENHFMPLLGKNRKQPTLY
ncbi:hypothetical protein HPB50_023289 [Hyalomma asiaticum]|uniref:Uncharacterized protein n=1 Tax=Hyalomma asiaticum TaxID=266040 RepID=A0ACB7TM47_HYAAI|nr:hypothetical protein HPB50_023289 [Hyalomma asiaticum]